MGALGSLGDGRKTNTFLMICLLVLYWAVMLGFPKDLLAHEAPEIPTKMVLLWGVVLPLVSSECVLLGKGAAC